MKFILKQCSGTFQISMTKIDDLSLYDISDS